MECYNFIKDEEQLLLFHSHLLSLKNDEVYYIMLGARRKYLTDEEKEPYNMNGSDMIKRVTVKNNSFEYFRKKVLELSAPIGTYTDKNGLELPEHSLTLYMTINPRDCRLASVNIIAKLAEKLHNKQPMNLEQFMYSEIHKSCNRKRFMDFDIDPNGSDNLQQIINDVKTILGKSSTIEIRTRTGAHILLDKHTIDKTVKNTFYKSIKQLSASLDGTIDFLSDAMVPIPGTTQGGTIPRLIL